MFATQSIPRFPKGCTIGNLRQGKGNRAHNIYADLIGPDGVVLISATLSYINEQMVKLGLESKIGIEK